MDVIEKFVHMTVVPEPPLGDLTEALIRNAVHEGLRADRPESLRPFCLREDTPDDVLLELYEQKLLLGDLAHRKGPRWLLERIARETRYPEAVITIAIELYASPRESAADFQLFLREHSENGWMLESLAYQRSSSEEKAKMLREVTARHPEGERILRVYQVAEWERQAESETKAAELKRLFQTREPRVWRSLAGNPAAPHEILEQLAEAQGVPLAREIRFSAKAALAQASRLSEREDGHD